MSQNLKQLAEDAGFWGHSIWAEELKEFAWLVVTAQMAGKIHVPSDTSLTDEPPPTASPHPDL